MITTTLKQLRSNEACISGYNKLVCSLSGKTFDHTRKTYIRFKHTDPIPLTYILESNGLDDALWSLRASNASHRDMRLYAVWCARQVQYLMTDQRSLNALDVAERFANGEATEQELNAARAIASAAASAADWAADCAAASAADWAASYAAASAADRAAALAAASYAASDAARAAAMAAARAAMAAAMAARAAAWAAASDADWAAQKEMFIKMCNGEAPWQKSE